MTFKLIATMLMVTTMPLIADAQTAAGIRVANMNQTVMPGNDFYQFATGGWQKANPLPAARSRYGSFDVVADENTKHINSILSDLKKKKFDEGTVERKLADFYALAMDSDRREREGTMSVEPLIKEIEAANDMAELYALMDRYAKVGLGVQYYSGFGADDKNASQNIFNLYQAGLTLGQRDYYVNNDSATVAIRNAYREHIKRMFRLYGFPNEEAEKRGEAVYRTEMVVALFSKSATELRDPQANYNKMTLEEVETKYPNLRVKELANAEGVKTEHLKEMIVGQPKFFESLDRLVELYTTDELKALMEWDIICGSASYLTDEIRQASFDFFGRTMQGRKEEDPLWKRATNALNGHMGEALGKMYVEKFFPASSKKMMEQLVENLRVSLGERIDAQEWMGDTTKAAAHVKLNKFYVKIGYPDKWTDYSKLNIDPAKSYYENIMECIRFKHDKAIEDKAGKPVDIEEWYMTPQTVNAYYNPTTNEICFPAGILQYPFFDPKADEAFNYGAIGVVIGHEMTHGFDDQGRQYDAEGNMKDWWTAQDAKGFEQRADLYAAFFDKIEVLPGLHANGRLTLGENLADHGGLQVAYHAFINATRDKKQQTKAGYTPAQRFFIAYAGVWGQNITEKEIRNRVKMDPHSLGEWRVNGALPHIDAWYDAFNVKEGDKMFIPKSERLDLW